MDTVRRYLDFLVESLGAVSLAVVFIVSFLQVISRFFFQIPIPWATDVVRIGFIYAIFFGAAIGLRNKGHLNIDLIFQLLPERTGKIWQFVVNLLIGAFLVFLVYQGTLFALGAGLQGTPYLRFPMAGIYAAIPVSALFMLFYLGEQIKEQFKELRQ